MADKKIINANVVYKFRGDKIENLQEINPILALKEPCFILDENNKAIGFKIGDGVTPWNNLKEHSLSSGVSEITIDQIFNPESENAQSGKAVAEAIRTIPKPTGIRCEREDSYGTSYIPTVEAEVYPDGGSAIRVYDEFWGYIPLYGIVTTGTEPTEAVNVEFLNSKIGDIETALDSVIAIQNSLIGGNE